MDTDTTTKRTPSSTLGDMWRTRPLRLPGHGKLAGVAAGIGYRYNVDPLLVRVIFVVTTIFGGAGAIMYVACWLLMPTARYTTPYHESKVKMVFWIIVLLLVGGPFIDPDRDPWGLVSAVVLLGGWYLLYQRQTETPAPPASSTAQSSTGEPLTTEDGESNSNTAATEPLLPPPPPTWDPLRAAPFAWDVPDQVPLPAPPAKPRSRVVSVTIGAALIISAVLVAIGLLGGSWVTPVVVAAAALVVLGVGMLVGAWLRSGYSLLFLAVPLAVFVIVASSIGPLEVSPNVGDQSYRVTEASDIEDYYEIGIGTITLDLTQVTLTHDKTVNLDVGMGDIQVLVPPSMNVHTSCEVSIGSFDCLPSPNGTGPVLTINATVNVGSIEVQRV
ncbi:PspC domain-containing protein [Mycobacteroides salmoniphilum]|uniref:PspC domain-containing protein n=1 Tax=Mycobacteroides salmoniphilum TaxID=404941 RepID=UPI0009943D43|nr:PspC domain-containing protein [Mycobacteroides salmoniphilum]QCH25240.1 PspC domain protein [Mycobacteroides salmoniphilum]